MNRTFRSQISFGSLLKILVIISFGSGLVVGLFSFIPYFWNGESIMNGLLLAILTPFISCLGAVITSTLGYPFYAWYCNSKRGQEISGKFLEVESDESNI